MALIIVAQRVEVVLSPYLDDTPTFLLESVSNGAGKSLLVIAIDVLKAVLACWLGSILLAPYGYALEGKVLAGVAVMVGHDFPALLGFRGGKGIATAFGSLLFIFPVHALIAFGVFLVLVAATKYVSLGSVCAALTLPALLFITHGSSNLPVCLIAAAIGISIVLRHHKNISRLLNHTENKLDLNKLLKKKS